MKVFVIDPSYCNGCHNCQIACKDEHVGNAWAPYAAAQPNTGHFWLKVLQKEHGQLPKVRIEYRPWLCMHCDNAACIAAAPDAVYKREDGLVIIDPEKAKGNRALVDACPYGAIYYNEDADVAQKCTGCAHLVDQGKLPHCVDLCATGALRFGEEEEFAAEIAQAEIMKPEAEAAPRVYYINLPHLFIAGEVWDPEANEIIEGAKVTLTCPDGSVVEQLTDDFGDFEFKKLRAGSYKLSIEAAGFAGVSDREIELAESLNVGDFPLQKA